MPLTYWDEAFLTATYLINRLPYPVTNNKSPVELLFQKSSDYNFLKVFGCACWPHLRPYNQHKLAFRSQLCVFLGYSLNHKGYRCLHVPSGRVYISRNVIFDETTFPFHHLPTATSSPSSLPQPISLPPSLSLPLNPPVPSPSYPPNPTSQSTSPSSNSSMPSSHATCPNEPPTPPTSLPDPCPQPAPISLPNVPPAPPCTQPAPCPPYNSTPHPNSPRPPLPTSHPMQTRSKSNIHKPRAFTDGTIFYPPPKALLTLKPSPTIEPTSFTTANQSAEWRAAMNQEFNALLQNGTWTLVPRHPNMNLIGCKWVYKIKRKSYGTIDRYKARLVAKGFHQQPGLDYGDTFSPVVKPTTIQIVLSLAVSSNWCIKQLDVTNAFLHGFLQENVYMIQPSGFTHPVFPNHVCHLQKSLYGLKQAPRAWFSRLSTRLLELGFTNSRADTSLFIYGEGPTKLFILIYVDDIIVTSPSSTLISSLISKLQGDFPIKDLGNLHYFLGVEVLKHNQGMFLSQRKYILDLLQKANMLSAKPVTSPMSSSTTLSLFDGEAFDDPSLYRIIVGSLQYLSLTRSDVSFAMNKVCQFLQHPTVNHWTAVKRILRYLKHTIFYGFLIRSNSNSQLHAYSDADWAGCPDDRRSTDGYCIFLGHNLISWSSRKQATVSRSSTEAEYRSLANTTAELQWLQSLLKELGVFLSSPPTLWCDNLGATYLTANPLFHAHTKHIEIDFHFVRDKVASKNLLVRFISTKDQKADIFTKPLVSTRFNLLRSNLNLTEILLQLRGHIKVIEDITQSSSPAHNSTSSNQHGKYLHEKTCVRSIQNTKETFENQATQKE